MGRLDNPCSVDLGDSFYDHVSNQFVFYLRYLRPNLPADLPQIVIHNGLGRDIWTVPFANITMMFKVCRD